MRGAETYVPMSNRFLICLLVLASVGMLALPYYMFTRDIKPDVVSAYGQWYGDAVVAIAAILAIYQLVLSKKSSEAEAFLKICAMVDEKAFLRSYDYIISRREVLQRVAVADAGFSALENDVDSKLLEEAALDVLYQLEKIGILVHHAIVNRRMVTDYIGEVVINGYGALSQVITYYQRGDRTMYERLVELRTTCIQNGWSAACATTMKATGIANS